MVTFPMDKEASAGPAFVTVRFLSLACSSACVIVCSSVVGPKYCVAAALHICQQEITSACLIAPGAATRACVMSNGCNAWWHATFAVFSHEQFHGITDVL